MNANRFLAGIITGTALMATACGSTTVNSSPSTPSPSSAPAGSAVATAWHPQAVADSAMPDPNQAAKAFSATQAIGDAVKWQSDFGLGQPGVNSAGQLVNSPQPGEVSEVFNKYQSQLMDSQETAYTFSSPELEQQFSATVASASSNGGLDYVLYGNGWAIGFDDGNADNLEYAQKLIGGSLVTYLNGEVQGFE
jgi:hypothetical protein